MAADSALTTGIDTEGCRDESDESDVVRKRLVCLDVIRGITMAVMVLVDMTGGAYPMIGHSPWNQVHLADFVMPFFLFTCGVSISLALKRLEGKRLATLRKVLWRCCMMFLVGVLIQGHDKDWKLDFGNFRIMGILQRIAIAYGIAAMVKVLVPTLPAHEVEVPVAGGKSLDMWLFSRYALQWAVVLLFLLAYLVIVHCVAVPRAGCTAADWIQGLDFQCNVAGWIDTSILGPQHVYRRGQNPEFGFDPEGLATTLGCIFTVYVGVHVGHSHVLIGKDDPWRCMRHWLALACGLLIIAFCIMPFVPFNKRMWSISYNLLMLGSACLLLVMLRALEILAARPRQARVFRRDLSVQFSQSVSKAAYIVEVLMSPFRWLGTNALLFFVFADSGGVLEHIVTKFYNQHPENNLVTWVQGTMLMDWFGLACPGWTRADHSTDKGKPGECTMILAYSLIEIFIWCCICGVLFRKRLFWKL